MSRPHKVRACETQRLGSYGSLRIFEHSPAVWDIIMDKWMVRKVLDLGDCQRLKTDDGPIRHPILWIFLNCCKSKLPAILHPKRPQCLKLGSRPCSRKAWYQMTTTHGMRDSIVHPLVQTLPWGMASGPFSKLPPDRKPFATLKKLKKHCSYIGSDMFKGFWGVQVTVWNSRGKNAVVAGLQHALWMFRGCVQTILKNQPCGPPPGAKRGEYSAKQHCKQYPSRKTPHHHKAGTLFAFVKFFLSIDK